MIACNFLGAFATLQKRLLSSSCLSVRPHGTTRLPLDGYSCNWMFEHFLKTCREILVSLKHRKNNGHFTWRCRIFMVVHLWILRVMRNDIGKNCRENQKRHLILNNTFTKIVTFVSECIQIRQRRTGHSWPCSTGLAYGFLRFSKTLFKFHDRIPIFHPLEIISISDRAAIGAIVIDFRHLIVKIGTVVTQHCGGLALIPASESGNLGLKRWVCYHLFVTFLISWSSKPGKYKFGKFCFLSYHIQFIV
jgi:hypothetical protein